MKCQADVADLVVGKRVLDLGSGTGLVAMIAAHLQQQAGTGSTLATDHNDTVLDRLSENVKRSASLCRMASLTIRLECGDRKAAGLARCRGRANSSLAQRRAARHRPGRRRLVRSRPHTHPRGLPGCDPTPAAIRYHAQPDRPPQRYDPASDHVDELPCSVSYVGMASEPS